MTPPPEGTPWWGWAIVVVVLAVITAASSWLATLGTRKNAAKAADRADKAATELEPNHGSSSRDSLTRIEAAIVAVQATQKSQGALLWETRRDVGGIREELRTERKERMHADERLHERTSSLEDTLPRRPNLGD